MRTIFRKSITALRKSPLHCKLGVIGATTLFCQIPINSMRKYYPKYSKEWYGSILLIHATIPINVFMRHILMLPKSISIYTFLIAIIGQII